MIVALVERAKCLDVSLNIGDHEKAHVPICHLGDHQHGARRMESDLAGGAPQMFEPTS